MLISSSIESSLICTSMRLTKYATKVHNSTLIDKEDIEPKKQKLEMGKWVDSSQAVWFRNGSPCTDDIWSKTKPK